MVGVQENETNKCEKNCRVPPIALTFAGHRFGKSALD